jgi:hypothetical protein
MPASVRVMSGPKVVTSVRQAAAVGNVSPPVVRRWLSNGLIPEPPWTLQQLQEVRELTHPDGRRRGPQPAHGTTARWNDGCSCATCRIAHREIARVPKRATAQARLPVEVRQQLLDGINAGQQFRAIIRELGLTSHQVWGLTKTDPEWSIALETALAATRREDLKHGTNAAYFAGCVCKECREHQRVRMAKNW